MQLFFLRHIASFTITRCSFTSCPRRKLRFCSHIPDEGDTEEVVRIEKSVVKVDDGGSDLTDRFKYKVWCWCPHHFIFNALSLTELELLRYFRYMP
jgi:hypothetical protein